MIGRKLKVTVWDREYEVSVFKDPDKKTVWFASCDYNGHHIEVKDRSEGAAIKRWHEAARYRGNG